MKRNNCDHVRLHNNSILFKGQVLLLENVTTRMEVFQCVKKHELAKKEIKYNFPGLKRY